MYELAKNSTFDELASWPSMKSIGVMARPLRHARIRSADFKG
jgi:hypothetical protein